MTSSTSALSILRAIKKNYPDVIPNFSDAKRKISVYFQKEEILLTTYS